MRPLDGDWLDWNWEFDTKIYYKWQSIRFSNNDIDTVITKFFKSRSAKTHMTWNEEKCYESEAQSLLEQKTSSRFSMVFTYPNSWVMSDPGVILKNTYPIWSMYEIFTYIWLRFIVNVGKYSSHRAPICLHLFHRSLAKPPCMPFPNSEKCPKGREETPTEWNRSLFVESFEKKSAKPQPIFFPWRT